MNRSRLSVDPPRRHLGMRRLILAVTLLVVALLGSIRLLWPLAGRYPQLLEQTLGSFMGQHVSLGTLQATWAGLRPRLVLTDVRLLDPATQASLLRVSHAYVEIDLLSSLARVRLQPSLLTLIGLRLTVTRQTDGRLRLAGMDESAGSVPTETGRETGAEAGSETRGESRGGENRGGENRAIAQWLWAQRTVGIDAGELTWCDQRTGACLSFDRVDLRIRGQGEHRVLRGTAFLPPALGERIELDVDLHGNPLADKDWAGAFYAKALGVHANQGPIRASLDALLGLSLVSGVCDMTLWGEVGAGGPKRLRGEGSARDIAIRKPGGDVISALSRLTGTFDWEQQAGGWRLSGQNLTLISGQGRSRWPPSRFHVSIRQDRREVSASFLRLQDMSALVLASRHTDPGVQETLRNLQPAGDVRNLHVSYRHGSQLVLQGHFGDLETRPWWGLPGLRGLDGTLWISGQEGALELESSAAELDYRPAFRWPLALRRVAGRITWQHTPPGQWRIATDDLVFHSDDIAAQVSSALTLFDDDTSPLLDLRVNIQNGRVAALSRYLPAQGIPQAAWAWLDYAFAAGHITRGHATVRGHLANFPFDAGDGEFTVNLETSDVLLRYRHDWPPLTHVDAQVRFQGRGLTIAGQSGKVLGSNIREAEVSIPDLTGHPAVLHARGVAEGPTQDALLFVAESPLRHKLGPYLEEVGAKGSSTLELDFILPLSPAAAKVNGKLVLRDNTLARAGIELSRLNGAVEFSERGLRSEGLRGHLWGEKVEISIERRGADEDAMTVVEARGETSAEALRGLLPRPLANSLHGRTGWQGKLRLPPTDRADTPVELHLASNLSGLSLNLPPPLAKPASRTEPFTLFYRLQERERTVGLRYGERLSAVLALKASPKASQVGVERGELRLGGETAVLPSRPGLVIAGHTPELSLDDWRFLFSGEGLSGEGKAPSIPAVGKISVDVGRLGLLGQTLHALSLRADRQGNRWNGTLSAEEAAGRFAVQLGGTHRFVDLDLQRLRLTSPVSAAEQQHSSPIDIPPLTVSSARFHYRDMDLGRLQLRTTSRPRGLHLEALTLSGETMDLQAQGDWLTENGQPLSRSTVTMTTVDLGKALELFGYAGNVRGGDAQMEIIASWPSTPVDLSPARMSGDLQIEVGKGRLLALDPGVGRVFGLLSLQTLPRRLSWDFSDLFGKGFSFDQIRGHFTVEKGSATIRELFMEGPAARVDIAGTLDLGAETYDQRVTVTPHVSSGLPLAGALAGGIGAGAVLFVVQKLLQRPIERIARIQYTVKGPWTSPVLTRVGGPAPNPAE